MYTPPGHHPPRRSPRPDPYSTFPPGCQPLRLACAAWGLLGLCLLALPLRVGAAVPTDPDRAVLEALYDETGGATWTERRNWKTDDGDWYGVTTDSSGNVTELKLFNNNLSGTIPAALGQLSHLTRLSLDNNNLSGPIPVALGQLSHLTRLSLSNNNLSGTIPVALGQLSRLTHLILAINKLRGPIPKELGQLSHLISLSLFINDLSEPIPPELGNMGNSVDEFGDPVSRLQTLHLEDNQLDGMIPAELRQLTELTQLSLDNNELSGAIPDELGQLTKLTKLYLHNNELSGAIPDELGHLSRLLSLSLDNNKLNGAIPGALGGEGEVPGLGELRGLSLHNNALSGAIPAELGHLTKLTHLILHNNALDEAIPDELGHLSRLLSLRLDNNKLSGAIPGALGGEGEVPGLGELRGSLHNNELSGAIPTELGDLGNLTHLILHNNALSGAIPTELGDLGNLTHLILHNNALSGAIPAELGQLSNLSTLNLHNNELSEAIPKELGELRSLRYLRLHNNALSGAVPAELGQLSNLRLLNLYNNARSRNAALSGPLPAGFTRLTALRELHAQNTYLTVPPALDSWAAARTVTTGTSASSGTISLDAANTAPVGVWANATTLYVSDPTAAKVFAYQVADGSREAAKDIPLAPENTDAQGLWGNESTLWVADFYGHKLYAYTLADGMYGMHDPDKDIALAETHPRALWGNETTVWVVDLNRFVYAYTLADGRRDMTNDFPSRLIATNRAPRGLWSDGTTVWVADPDDARLYAYTLADGSHDATKYRVLDPANTAPRGVWSDGTTWYVADDEAGVVYVYRNQGPEAVGRLPDLVLAIGGSAQTVTVTNAFWDPDRDALTYSAASSDTAVATVSVMGAEVAVQPHARGTVTITVTATDEDGSQMTATQTFAVRIGPPPPPPPGPPGPSGPPRGGTPGGDATQGDDSTAAEPTGYLENPGDDSFQSGIGLISGWVCEADAVEIEMEAESGTVHRYEAGYGTERADTAIQPDGTPLCGDTDNGFGLLFNWNLLGDGEHTVVAYVDEEELGRATVTVTTVGTGEEEEFLRDVAGACVVADFPMVGQTTTLEWQETKQNFVITRGPRPAGESRAGVAGVGYLENPGPNSFQSGIGVISGWVCEAEAVEIVFETAQGGVLRFEAAYGTERADTAQRKDGTVICGDTDNGFGLLFNWNLLGDGEHTVRALVDEEELGRAVVRVTTVGTGEEEEFLRDAEGECVVEDFPMPGETVTLDWQQSWQNFVITDVE